MIMPRTESELSDLWKAINNNDYNTVKQALENGAAINAPTPVVTLL